MTDPNLVEVQLPVSFERKAKSSGVIMIGPLRTRTVSQEKNLVKVRPVVRAEQMNGSRARVVELGLEHLYNPFGAVVKLGALIQDDLHDGVEITTPSTHKSIWLTGPMPEPSALDALDDAVATLNGVVVREPQHVIHIDKRNVKEMSLYVAMPRKMSARQMYDWLEDATKEWEYPPGMWGVANDTGDSEIIALHTKLLSRYGHNYD